MPRQPWIDSETVRLRELAERGAARAEILAAFPTRTWPSIEPKMRRDKLWHLWRSQATTVAEDIARARKKHDEESYEKKYRKIVRVRAVEERMIQAMAEAVTALPPVATPKKIPAPSPSKTEQAVVLLYADPHTGQVVSEDETCGLAKYDFHTFCIYNQFLADTLIRIVETLRRGMNIQDLHVNVLGDMVSGDIHEELAITNDLNPFHATAGCAFIMAQLVRDLAPHFRTIYLRGVIGNHGRMTKRKRFKEAYATNWDYIVYSLLSLLVKDQPNVVCDFPYSFFMFPEIMGHLHLLMHGDHIPSYLGIPLYGVKRAAASFTELLASKGKFIRYINLAHFHNKATLDRASGEIIISPGFVGGDEYSLGRMFTVSEPKQLFYTIHPEKGKTSEWPILFRYAERDGGPLRYSYNPDAQLLCQVKDWAGEG